MPLTQSRQPLPLSASCRVRLAVAALTVGVIGALSSPAWSAPAGPLAIRSRQAELHYQLGGAGPAAEVELWYTRDRAATWQLYGPDADRASPLIFVAPAEGLYGFILIVHDGERASREPPTANDAPQQWVFIDYSPPLAQWDNLEPAEAFATSRIVHLRWTAYDNNLPSRPVSLSYQSSVDQTWKIIDPAVPNTGRYDWTVPANAAGQITLKLAVRDQGGHVVERLYGPVSVERWLALSSMLSAAGDHKGATSRPAAVAGTAPGAEPGDATRRQAAFGPQPPTGDGAQSPPVPTDLARQRKAEELYRQGSWHLVRGQYALAAERLREALESDPNMLAAMNDLAGIHYLQQDYSKAVNLYDAVLSRDNQHALALRGAHLAYVAQRQYPQSRSMLERLLKVNDKDAEAWLDLGDVLFMMGDQSGARQQWSRAETADGSASAVIQKARRRLELYGPPPAAETAARPSKQP